MVMNENCEKLLLSYLDPTKLILPTEIHELSRCLLDVYRQQTGENSLGVEASFLKFMSQIIVKYYPYVEEIVVKKNIVVEERHDVLKWWKELLAVPSIQGILVATPYSYAAPTLKLLVVAGYLVKEKWNKRSLRELIKTLSEEVSEGRLLHNFSERIQDREAVLFRHVVPSADPEVDELAILLEEARRRIYYDVYPSKK